MDVATAKQALRARMRAALTALPPARRALQEELVTAAIQDDPAWRNASTVLLYRSVGTELSTVGLANAAWRMGKRVAFPRQTPDGLQLHVVDAWSQFVPGRHGIPEPAAAAPPISPSDVALAIVPGVAFDPAGGRLGRGGGDYDRLLPRLAVAWGIAFDEQVIPEVPMEMHDQPVHRVVYARGITA